MVQLTRLNGTPIIVNSDLIKLAESSPDTMLTLIHGEKIIVRESCDEIVSRIIAYRARLLAAVAAQADTPVPGEILRIAATANIPPLDIASARTAQNSTTQIPEKHFPGKD